MNEPKGRCVMSETEVRIFHCINRATGKPDDLEGVQCRGATLESFREPKTRAIRVRGDDFTVLIQESGAVVIHYPDRTIHISPDGDPAIERKPVHERGDAPSPRSDQATQRRGAR